MIRTHRFRVIIAFASVALAACREAPTTPASTLATGPAAFSAQPAREDVMAGEVIVGIRDGANVDAVAREHGLALGSAGYRNSFFVLRGQSGNERVRYRTAREPRDEETHRGAIERRKLQDDDAGDDARHRSPA